MKKPAIPSPSNTPPDVARVLLPIKDIIDHITGVRSGQIAALDDGASLSGVIDKINEIISRLNFSE